MASEIAQLAALVLTHTVKVDDFLQKSKLPTPNFHEDGPIELGLSPEVESARVAAIEASLRHHDLLRGPVELIRPTVNAVSLEAIYKYDIASKVPIHGEISIVELAKQCESMSPTYVVFYDLRSSTIGHSKSLEKVSSLIVQLQDDLSKIAQRVIVLNFSLMMHGNRSQESTVEAMQKWTDQEPNKTGFSLAHNTDKSVFEYMETHPAKAKRFAGAMSSFASYTGHGPEYLARGYPWASLGNKTVVDVGGSEGKYSIALAQSFPQLKFIVQDLPAVVTAVNSKRPVPLGLEDRVTFMEHDMFTEQPVSADVYMFRFVFHDWPDKYVVRILRQLIPALKPGARIIISDSILPEPNTLSELNERKIRALDMVMLSFFNSRERERDDWERVCQEVDPRFRFVDAWVPEGAALGIIEAVWQPESPVETETLKAIESVKGPGSVNEYSSTSVMNSIDGTKGMGLNGRNGVISVKSVDDVDVN